MVGQIGTGKKAEKFLDGLRNRDDIKRVTYVTTGMLPIYPERISYPYYAYRHDLWKTNWMTSLKNCMRMVGIWIDG